MVDPLYEGRTFAVKAGDFSACHVTERRESGKLKSIVLYSLGDKSIKLLPGNVRELIVILEEILGEK